MTRGGRRRPAPPAAPFRVGYLADHPGALPAVAAWLHAEWLAAIGLAPAEAEARLRRRLNRDRVPLALVALAGDVPVGTVSLVEEEDDVPGVPPPRYALAGLFVPPPWRRRGVGTLLCRRAVEEARRLRLPHLLVFTPDRAAFYARRGWRKRGDVPVAFGDDVRDVALLEWDVQTTHAVVPATRYGSPPTKTKRPPNVPPK